ncbi:hypothetical protein KBC04_00925 [Candidatus Babeliales bacterium]|nr:hypothetical protein [Candidatus Babeliales bacterium]MBP9843702.1 hypothetical protein [Candidatus Babeliales bacterium]
MIIDNENKESIANSLDMEKIRASIAELTMFYWTNLSDTDGILHVKLFSIDKAEPFEHDYTFIAGIDSWFTLAPGKAYFYYNNQPLVPLDIHPRKFNYYIVIHKDGTIQCGSEKIS